MMKIYSNGYYGKDGMFIPEGRAITSQDLDDIARYMDDDIRERIHAEIAPCSPEEFLMAYLDADPDFGSVLTDVFQMQM